MSAITHNNVVIDNTSIVTDDDNHDEDDNNTSKVTDNDNLSNDHNNIPVFISPYSLFWKQVQACVLDEDHNNDIIHHKNTNNIESLYSIMKSDDCDHSNIVLNYIRRTFVTFDNNNHGVDNNNNSSIHSTPNYIHWVDTDFDYDCDRDNLKLDDCNCDHTTNFICINVPIIIIEKHF